MTGLAEPFPGTSTCRGRSRQRSPAIFPAAAELVRRRDTGAGECWQHVQPVDIDGEGRLVLALNPGLRIHPESSAHCDEYPGEVDLMLDDGRRVIGVGMTGEAAQLLAYRLLAASADREWRVARERERNAREAVSELREVPGDELRAQWKAIHVRRGRPRESRCELIPIDDGHTQDGRLANAQRLIDAELRRGTPTPHGQPEPRSDAAAGCEPWGRGEW